MKKKHQKIQIILVSIGLILIFITYFYYPYMNKEKSLQNKSVLKEQKKSFGDDKDTTFENVEYKGLYNLNSPFTIRSKTAHILNEEPNIVYMNDMHVVLYLSDGRIVNIVSDEGRYNKANYDCFFKKNVKATDGETKIFSENLDLLATENSVEIYNNVTLSYPMGLVEADKINYDFETKYFKVSMFDEEVVKMKVIK